MSRRDYWMENAFAPATHTLVDLGYLSAESTRERFEKLRKLLGRENFQLVAYARLLVRLPKTKRDSVLSRFPEIREASARPGYCWCTHTWLDVEEKR